MGVGWKWPYSPHFATAPPVSEVVDAHDPAQVQTPVAPSLASRHGQSGMLYVAQPEILPVKVGEFIFSLDDIAIVA